MKTLATILLGLALGAHAAIYTGPASTIGVSSATFYGSKTVTWGNFYLTNVPARLAGWYSLVFSNNTGGANGDTNWVVWKQIGSTNYFQLNDPGFAQNGIAPIPATTRQWTVGSGTNDSGLTTTELVCNQNVPGTLWLDSNGSVMTTNAFGFFATTNTVAVVTNIESVSRQDIGTRYVSLNGDDNNDGLSRASAYYSGNRALPYAMYNTGVSNVVFDVGTYECNVNVSNATITGSGIEATRLVNPGVGTAIVVSGYNSRLDNVTLLGDVSMNVTAGNKAEIHMVEIPEYAHSIDGVAGGSVYGALTFDDFRVYSDYDALNFIDSKSSGTFVFKNSRLECKNSTAGSNPTRAFNLSGTNSTWIFVNTVAVLSNTAYAGTGNSSNTIFSVNSPGIKLFLGGLICITNNTLRPSMFTILGDGTGGNFGLMPTVYSLDSAQTIVAPSTVSSNSTTAFSLTATSTNIMGQSQIILNRAGTYLLMGGISLLDNGSTFAAVQTNTFTFQRTNNTAAALGTAQASYDNIVTGFTGSGGTVTMNPFQYTTANTNDVISIYGKVSTVPAAGTVDVSDSWLTVFPIRINP